MAFSDPHDFMGVPDGVSLDALDIAYAKRKRELLNSNPVSMEALKDLELAYQILQWEYGEDEEDDEDDEDEENTLTEEEQRIIDNLQPDEDELEEVVAHANSVDSEEDAEDSTYQDEEEILSAPESPAVSQPPLNRERTDYTTLKAQHTVLHRTLDELAKAKDGLQEQYCKIGKDKLLEEYAKFMSSFRIDSPNIHIHGVGEGRIHTLIAAGIESAWDIDRKRNSGLWATMGLGPKTKAAIEQWADAFSECFPHDELKQVIDQKIEKAHERRKQKIEQEISQTKYEIERVKGMLQEARYQRFILIVRRIFYTVGALAIIILLIEHA